MNTVTNSDMPSAPGCEDEVPQCDVCGGEGGDFLPVAGSELHVHRRCLDQTDAFALCWCCENQHHRVAYFSHLVNENGECPDHAGESEPDGPDSDDIIENIINNA